MMKNMQDKKSISSGGIVTTGTILRGKQTEPRRRLSLPFNDIADAKDQSFASFLHPKGGSNRTKNEHNSTSRLSTHRQRKFSSNRVSSVNENKSLAKSAKGNIISQNDQQRKCKLISDPQFHLDLNSDVAPSLAQSHHQQDFDKLPADSTSSRNSVYDDTASVAGNTSGSLVGDIEIRDYDDREIIIQVECFGTSNNDNRYNSVPSVCSVGSDSVEEREKDRHHYSMPLREENVAFNALRGVPADLANDETRFPTALYSVPSEAAKSDIATVCSGSVVEDIDVASVMSGDLGVQLPLNGDDGIANPSIQSFQSNLCEKSIKAKISTNSYKNERNVEFAAEPSAFWKQMSLDRLKKPYSRINANLGSSGIILHDMGPPLSRRLLLERAGVGNGSRLTGICDPSQPESVRSQSSQAPSDLICVVDSDDCGGSLVESDCHGSMNESNSVHSQDETTLHSSQQNNVNFSESQNNDGQLINIETAHETDPNKSPDNRLSGFHTNGRTSPGGTVYKGRGVRRYQGRYMHLPLKRFHQNGITLDTSTPIMDFNLDSNDHYSNHHGGVHIASQYRNSWERPHDRNHNTSRCYNGSRDNTELRSARKKSWSRSRSRSRSRSPTPQMHCKSPIYADNRECSPNFSTRKYGSEGIDRRWRNNRGGRNCRSENKLNHSENSSPRKKKDSRRRGCYQRTNRLQPESPCRSMTPRNIRHNRDSPRRKAKK